MSCYIVLYDVMLFVALLKTIWFHEGIPFCMTFYVIKLYCILLFVPYCCILCRIILSWSNASYYTMFYSIVCCSVLYMLFAFYHILLSHIILHYTTLYHISNYVILHNVIFCYIESYCIV